MNEIQRINETPLLQPQSGTGKSKPGQFQATLETALSSKGNPTTPIGEKTPLGEVAAVYPNVIKPGGTQYISQTEQLLDMLDDYATQLNDPGKSLKDLAPLLAEIKRKTEMLVATSNTGATTNERLKDIANTVALTASVEYEKFQRGDFL